MRAALSPGQVVDKINWPCKAVLALLCAVCLISWTQAGLSLWLLQAAVCSPLAAKLCCGVGGSSGRDELFHCFAVPANISLICHFAHLQQSWEEGDAVLIAKVLGCCVALSCALV